MTFPRSKYGVRQDAAGKAARTYNGVLFDSKAEAAHCMMLDILVKAGKIHSYERQVNVPLEVNGVKVATIRPDFRLRYPDGRTVLQDVKGFLTPEWKLKHKLFKAIHGYEIELVK